MKNSILSAALLINLFTQAATTPTQTAFLAPVQENGYVQITNRQWIYYLTAFAAGNKKLKPHKIAYGLNIVGAQLTKSTLNQIKNKILSELRCTNEKLSQFTQSNYHFYYPRFAKGLVELAITAGSVTKIKRLAHYLKELPTQNLTVQERSIQEQAVAWLIIGTGLVGTATLSFGIYALYASHKPQFVKELTAEINAYAYIIQTVTELLEQA